MAAPPFCSQSGGETGKPFRSQKTLALPMLGPDKRNPSDKEQRADKPGYAGRVLGNTEQPVMIDEN